MHPKKKKGFFLLIIVLLPVFLIVFISEIILRLIDIPGIDKNTHYAIDMLVGYGDVPHGKLFYCNNKGDIVRRRFNSYGYLDAEHKKEKGSGIYRIGFFGDSYVEARQVPLENTFFRAVEKGLEDYKVECMAFGRESGGTLVSYLNSGRWSGYFDIDLIVYVFCENDLGDNIKQIKEKTAPYFPFAYLTNAGYGVDYSGRDRLIHYSHTVLYKVKDFFSKHFLICRLIKNRMQLVISYGLKLNASQKHIAMSSKIESTPKKPVIPDQNDPPSMWPGSLKEYAEKLGEAIILKWKNDIETEGKKFAIFYVPRQVQMGLEAKNQDSWKDWLESFCKNNNIAFIDPSRDLIKTEASGNHVFYDHFTIYGHKAFSASFIKWFKEKSSQI